MPVVPLARERQDRHAVWLQSAYGENGADQLGGVGDWRARFCVQFGLIDDRQMSETSRL